MIEAAALALSLTIGGPDYDAALARATRYRSDPAADAFTSNHLGTIVQPALEELLPFCTQYVPRGGSVKLMVVISYKAGLPDHVFLSQDTPAGRCVAVGLAGLELPASAPLPDYAYRLGVTLHN
jgi:hypothetical protein